MAAARFADYFNHSETADVKVVIEVVQNDENLARRHLQLQGTVCEPANADLWSHAIILFSSSPVWKAELQRWQDTGEPKKITMVVEKGEEAAAHKLVQCLYTASLPAIEIEVDLRVNLGILMLADQYQVEAALSLAAEKLEKLTDLGLISWDLADRVMQLPAGYLEKPGFSHLLVKIQEKILHHVWAEPSLPGIGLDLEVVMCNPSLEKALMALPLRKCASLLSDDRCRVASENTVAAAVVQRVDRERMRAGDGDLESVQSAELRAQIMADVIRVPHLSSLFAAALLSFASQLTTVVRPDIFVLGRELDRLTAAVQRKLTDEAKGCTIPRCWLCGRRPPSSVTALEFDWEASTAALAHEFDALHAPTSTSLLLSATLARSRKHFFAGMDWQVKLWAEPGPEKEGRMVGVYVFGRYPLRPEGPPYGATVNLSILAPDKKSSLHRQLLVSIPAGRGKGWENPFNLPPMQKWDQSRVQKWTSADGFLTLRVKISGVM